MRRDRRKRHWVSLILLHRQTFLMEMAISMTCNNNPPRFRFWLGTHRHHLSPHTTHNILTLLAQALSRCIEPWPNPRTTTVIISWSTAIQCPTLATPTSTILRLAIELNFRLPITPISRATRAIPSHQLSPTACTVPRPNQPTTFSHPQFRQRTKHQLHILTQLLPAQTPTLHRR